MNICSKPCNYWMLLVAWRGITNFQRTLELILSEAEHAKPLSCHYRDGIMEVNSHLTNTIASSFSLVTVDSLNRVSILRFSAITYQASPDYRWALEQIGSAVSCLLFLRMSTFLILFTYFLVLRMCKQRKTLTHSQEKWARNSWSSLL